MSAEGQVRPLRRFRTPHQDPPTSDGFRTYVPKYGDRAYLTNDYQFCIRWLYGSWRIQRHFITKPSAGAVESAGLYDAIFPRRIDAVHALEHVLQ